MDKYEYKVRADEIKALISDGNFTEAIKIADLIDWHRVKSVMMLCTISDLYKLNRRFQESKDILLMAYERHPGGRLIIYSLCELSIKMGEFVQAIEYYKEFVQIAPKDTGRYILQYKLYEAQDVSLEERIAVLEEFKKRDYREKWAYELAYLYHRVGLETKCIEECDEMILWFGEGRHVLKALELKALHLPLSEEQKDKYNQMKREMELQREQAEKSLEQEDADEASDDEEEADDSHEDELNEDNGSEEEEYNYGEQEQDHKIADFSEYTSQKPEKEEYQIKTADVGQFNTMNLQKELAESMKVILQEENKREVITRSIVAPLLQETGELSEDILPSTGVWAPIQTEQKVIQTEQKVIQTEQKVIQTEQKVIQEEQKVIQEEQEVIQEDQDKAAKDIAERLTDDIKDMLTSETREISPGQRIIYPSVLPSGTGNLIAYAETQKTKSAQIQKALSNNSEQARQEHQEQRLQETAPETAAPLIQVSRPSGFEQMLSQEYDGQISLVIPEKSAIEKQITGQIEIADIMAEWERMKKQNEEKRREDVKQRVKQHTGNLFADFDEATKTGLLEQLEKAVVAAILKESGETQTLTDALTAQRISDIVHSVEKEKRQAGAETQEQHSVPVQAEEEAVEEAVGAVKANQPEAISVPHLISVPHPSQPDQVSAGAYMEEAIPPEKLKDIVEDAGRSRELSEEEQELFARFVHNRRSKEQIIHAVDTMSMDSYTDNVVITGEAGTGTIDLAKGLIRMMQMSDSNFSGKVAKISGEILGRKNVQTTLSKLADGAVIIENAPSMSSKTAEDLNKALSQENSGLFVILEGTKESMNKLMSKNIALQENFNARIDVEALDDHALVEFAKQYAEEMEYSIDELGILALHTRIAEMQTSDHEVTVVEVQELVDDAIYFADKKNPAHLIDILFGKRYDEEDMIILREKDFMHY